MDGQYIDHADPVIGISAKLLDAIRRGESSWASAEKPDGYPEIVTLRATNRTVVYAVSEYHLAVDAYECHWPD
jgi:hypothetical protein